MTKLKNSGDNQKFSTGAVRDTAAGKPMPGLISPYATLREADILAKGAVHYGSRNWEAGIPIARCIESLERHIMQYKMGLTDEDHMAQARCNTGFILHFEEMIKRGIIPPEIDDMPKYEQGREEEERTIIDPEIVGRLKELQKTGCTVTDILDLLKKESGRN